MKHEPWRKTHFTKITQFRKSVVIYIHERREHLKTILLLNKAPNLMKKSKNEKAVTAKSSNLSPYPGAFAPSAS